MGTRAVHALDGFFSAHSVIVIVIEFDLLPLQPYRNACQSSYLAHKHTFCQVGMMLYAKRGLTYLLRLCMVCRLCDGRPCGNIGRGGVLCYQLHPKVRACACGVAVVPRSGYCNCHRASHCAQNLSGRTCHHINKYCSQKYGVISSCLPCHHTNKQCSQYFAVVVPLVLDGQAQRLLCSPGFRWEMGEQLL